jgi:hypothetical protein
MLDDMTMLKTDDGCNWVTGFPLLGSSLTSFAPILQLPRMSSPEFMLLSVGRPVHT